MTSQPADYSRVKILLFIPFQYLRKTVMKGSTAPQLLLVDKYNVLGNATVTSDRWLSHMLILWLCPYYNSSPDSVSGPEKWAWTPFLIFQVLTQVLTLV